jgi:hypothetical protein
MSQMQQEGTTLREQLQTQETHAHTVSSELSAVQERLTHAEMQLKRHLMQSAELKRTLRSHMSLSSDDVAAMAAERVSLSASNQISAAVQDMTSPRVAGAQAGAHTPDANHSNSNSNNDNNDNNDNNSSTNADSLHDVPLHARTPPRTASVNSLATPSRVVDKQGNQVSL